MRKAILLAALGVALAGASAAGAAAPTFSKAEGAGSFGPGCETVPPLDFPGQPICFPFGHTFEFSAVDRGPFHANGFYAQTVTGRPPGFRGDVTCLNVIGNTGVVGGVLTEPAAAAGIPFVAYMVDNGPNNGTTPPDLISPLGIFPEGDVDLAFLPQGFPHVCPPPEPSIYGYFPVDQGDVVVQEGTIAFPHLP